ncbi:ABC-2 family transporter protein [Chitinophaga sp. CF118]|uniref:ABC transporter permease n=1 Tax=Chitinophaga sp. CF118 TaxID=1884367 RepID=UPI0008E0AF70|nr:ABC transporter permease [Chitinophaga sp. CF118]SFD14374.1 ABC-2 family transporter protein [Chitinophaga sp. CF118]
MLQIIKIEWLKVKVYRTFWILLGMAVAIIPASNLIVQDITSRIPKEARTLLGGTAYDFPLVWQSVANVSSYTSGIFSLLLLTLVTNEFTFKTHRQNVIDGWDRRDFVFAKLFWVLALAVLALVVSMLTALYFGFFYGEKAFSAEGISYMGYYFLQVLLSLCMALLLAIFVKRAGLAIVLYLGYIMAIEQLLVLTIKRYWGSIGGLLPLQAGDELIPFPLGSIGKMMPGLEQYDTSIYLLALFAYIVLALWLIFRRLLRADI